jgi:putative ABC transport system permease protein
MGLSVAFAAFMTIMVQLNYDLSFDKFHKDHDKIFRLELLQETSVQTNIPRPLADLFFESSPHIMAGAVVSPFPYENYFNIEDDGVRDFFTEKCMSVAPEFIDVFTFDFVEGSKDAFKARSKIIIPLSLSRKIFGNEPAVDKQLREWTVGAIYRDFPSNSIVNNYIYRPSISANQDKENWSNFDYDAYFRVDEASNLPLIYESFKRKYNALGGDPWEDIGAQLRFTALPDIHFVTNVSNDTAPKASRQTLMILFSIAIVIIIIASINFINFSAALTPIRVKRINTQRVLGAQRNTLRIAIVAESAVICFLSYLVALCLISVFRTTPWVKLVDGNLSFAANPLIFGGTAFIALLTGLFAGIFPSRYMTSFEPALALKGYFGLSSTRKQMRNILIGIQFVSSFALLIGVSFMYLQNRFMQNSALGFDKDELITVNIGRIQNSRDAFVDRLKSYSGIEDVTFGEVLLSGSDIYMKWGIDYNGKRAEFQCIPVHYSFLKVMGIHITEGRDFRQEDADLQNGVYVFNETARKIYDLKLNTMVGDGGIESGEIIGFIQDVNVTSFRLGVAPMAFYVWGTKNWGRQPGIAYIRLKPGVNKHEAMAYIHSTLAGFDANFPFQVRFYDEVLQQLYEKETSLISLISLFSLMAIFISVVGVFGLVVFDGECRRKEIGIRKVYGASVAEIILMFNRRYLKILVICFLIAAPLAFYVVSRWLENFAYKTPVYWWVYLLAFIILSVIILCTVTFQNWSAANEDPVKSIKTE